MIRWVTLQCNVLHHLSAAVLEVEEACELHTQYTLVVRRASENQLVAACEVLSPTNKGVFDALEKEKYLRKRMHYFHAGVNVLEVDALLQGARLLPGALAALAQYSRSAWTAFHHPGGRRLRGWGWNLEDSLPVVNWGIEQQLEVVLDLGGTFLEASEFNPWEELAREP